MRESTKEQELERKIVKKTLTTVVELLDSVLPNNIELVLHGVLTPESTILAIANGHITEFIVKRHGYFKDL